MEPAKVEEWKESIKNRMNNFVSRIFQRVVNRYELEIDEIVRCVSVFQYIYQVYFL